MDGHPIESLIKTSMESIKEMVDVNTIVGDAVETPDGSVIIPVSKVTFGFAAGGGEFNLKTSQDNDKGSQQSYPFGGGSGAGVSVQPVAFMVVGQGQIRLLPVTQNAMIERIIDIAPQILDQLKSVLKKNNETITVQAR
ncbi:MAG: GerW family sporulation protein [Tepidanaerobacteraceae bacterium]|jgi:sporulation protein YtfJ|nr:GerW family sporulation protein [Tepidanaerobacteraceae bacterium]